MQHGALLQLVLDFRSSHVPACDSNVLCQAFKISFKQKKTFRIWLQSKHLTEGKLKSRA